MLRKTSPTRKNSQPVETTYEVRIKGLDPVQVEKLKTEIKGNPNARVVLPISVGQLYHENGKFRETLGFLEALGFKHFEILVGDTLQRWTKLIEYPLATNLLSADDVTRTLDSRTTETRDDGQKWIGRNEESLRTLGCYNYVITYWDDIVSTAGTKQSPIISGFQEKNDFYRALYQNDSLFKEAVDNSAKEYLNRLQKKGPRTFTQNELDFSVNYIIEETSALHAMYEAYKKNEKQLLHLAYPRGINAALKYARINCFGIVDGVYPFTELKLGIQTYRENLSSIDRTPSTLDSLAKTSEKQDKPRKPQHHSANPSLEQLGTSFPNSFGLSPFAFFAVKNPTASSIPQADESRTLLLRLLAANAESSRLQMEMLFQIMNSAPQVVATAPGTMPQSTTANIDGVADPIAPNPVRIQ